jgi:hypothetical protein
MQAQWRTSRSIANPLWIGALISLSFAVVLVFASAGAQDWHPEDVTFTSIAVPVAPLAHLDRTDSRQEFTRAPADLHLPSEPLGLFSERGLEAAQAFFVVQYPVATRICPLYRRPPPISS